MSFFDAFYQFFFDENGQKRPSLVDSWGGGVRNWWPQCEVILLSKTCSLPSWCHEHVCRQQVGSGYRKQWTLRGGYRLGCPHYKLGELGGLFWYPFSFLESTWSECYANCNNSNRSTTNARSMRTNFSVLEGGQQTLVIRITAIALASDSAITIPRFRPSKPPARKPIL